MALGAAALATTSAGPGFAKFLAPRRSLSLYNVHTSESLTVDYFANGCCIPGAVAEIQHILRDYRTGEQHDIDVGLLDLLATLHDKLDASGPFHVISGYRSPVTNERLHEESSAVAKHSLHMVGKAIDIRLPGRSLVNIRNAALNLQAGGVGYYPQSQNDFVHVDVGRVRHWGASA